jgi:hypothetical protein
MMFKMDSVNFEMMFMFSSKMDAVHFEMMFMFGWPGVSVSYIANRLRNIIPGLIS